MANPCDLTEETGTFGEGFSAAIYADSTDSGVFSDGTLFAVTTLLVEAGTLTDAWTERRDTDTVERGTFSTAAAVAGTFGNDIVEHGTIGDTVVAQLITNLVETGTFGSSFTLSLTSLLVESGHFSDATSIAQTLTNLLVEAGLLQDEVSIGFTTFIAETGSIADAVSNDFVLTTLVVQNGTLGDAVVVFNTAVNSVIEHGVIADVVSSLLNTSSYAVESGLIEDVATGGGAAGAMAAHLETFAMSRYTNFPFGSMAVVDGVLMATAEGGVYRLDADDDAGAQIDAAIVHDWTDKVADQRTGDPSPQTETKRPRYLYLTGRADGDMAVSIGYVDEAGDEAESDDCTLLLRGNAGFAGGRAGLPRGISSVYLRPTLRNVGGVDFSINDAKLVVDSTTRKI